MQMHLVMPAVNAKTSLAKTADAKDFRIAEQEAQKGKSPKREKTQ
jgi:hypothetical protein